MFEIRDFLMRPLKVDLISVVIDDLKIQNPNLVFNIVSGMANDILFEIHSQCHWINK